MGLTLAWIRLQEGCYELLPDGHSTQFVNLTPQEASEFLGLTVRAIQHYVLLLRHGSILDFDFEENLDQGISALR